LCLQTPLQKTDNFCIVEFRCCRTVREQWETVVDVRVMAAAVFLVVMSCGLNIPRSIHSFCISNARWGNTVVETAVMAVSTCSAVIAMGAAFAGSGSVLASSMAASKAVSDSPLSSALQVAALSVGPLMVF
jgi:hypothetical protein